jgi:hypothetical protein
MAKTARTEKTVKMAKTDKTVSDLSGKANLKPHLLTQKPTGLITTAQRRNRSFMTAVLGLYLQKTVRKAKKVQTDKTARMEQTALTVQMVQTAKTVQVLFGKANLTPTPQRLKPTGLITTRPTKKPTFMTAKNGQFLSKTAKTVKMAMTDNPALTATTEQSLFGKELRPQPPARL